MSRTRVCLLWHMHQPLYRIDGEPTAYLPWVRLHGIRSYYDMVRVLDEFPEIRVTINLTPVLIEQLRAYERGGSDAFLETAAVPAEKLSDHQRRFLFDNFFVANAERMIRPIPAFSVLLDKRNTALGAVGRESAWREFSDDDYRDLQALYDLCWFGFKAVEDFPRLAQLRRQERFSDDDIREIHGIEREIISKILPLYAEAAQEGQIELATTPYYHPILPLLIDTDAAREAVPEAPLPKRFCAPEDALAHVERALAYVEQEMGTRPKGMWPAEGSVSQAAASLLAACSVQWIASDEEVLAHSEHGDGASPYRPWLVETQGGSIRIAFRDHDLSDRIGFRYQSWSAADAVGDLLHALGHHVNKFKKADDLVVIALDGENPWEYYPDAGSFFLRELYARLSGSDTLQAACLGEATQSASQKLQKLHAGSWIYASFSTWIGGPQKNQAWELLARCHASLRTVLSRTKVREEGRTAAERCLLAAEGSDWMWWLDGQFESAYIREFEALFRGHLARAFERLGEPIPAELTTSLVAVLKGEVSEEVIKPFDWVYPRLDGRRTNTLEWHGAVRLGWPNVRAEGAMQRTRWPLGALWLGFAQPDLLCLRVDPARLEAPRTWFHQFALDLKTDGTSLTLTGLFSDKGILKAASIQRAAGETRAIDLQAPSPGVSAASGDILELCASCTLLGIPPGKVLELRMRLQSEGEEIPLRPLRLQVPAFEDRGTKA